MMETEIEMVQREFLHNIIWNSYMMYFVAFATDMTLTCMCNPWIVEPKDEQG